MIHFSSRESLENIAQIDGSKMIDKVNLKVRSRTISLVKVVFKKSLL